jgi:hypothetical protein
MVSTVITKGVRGEVLITLDEHFKHYHVPETRHQGNIEQSILSEPVNWNFIEYLLVSFEVLGDLTSNTGQVKLIQTTDGEGSGDIDDTISNLAVGSRIDNMYNCTDITGVGKLEITLDSEEEAHYMALKNLDIHRMDSLAYPV